ncbi:MAG: hypothetical protein K8I27_17365 [Planctomycetes bacterium]|nr:hypothetical protein [Planctomycetota bacterium]
MSLQLRCNCGWTSQVSEYYLGDHISCPDCGVRLSVHAKVGVPYGYAPYPTWQKKPVPRPARYRPYPLFTPEDPNAGPAFWLGLFALMLVLTGCGAIPGAMLALFGVNSWARSRKFARHHKQPGQSRASVGLGMSALALVVAGVMMLGLFVDRDCGRAMADQSRECHDDYEQIVPRAPLARPGEPTDLPAPPAKQGYRYPEPSPVEPRDDFEQRQVEYSRKIREEREAAAKSREEAVSPAGRYGD